MSRGVLKVAVVLATVLSISTAGVVQAATVQQAYIKASNAEAGDYFGSSVAIDNNTLVVGAMLEDSHTAEKQDNNDADFAGAAYVFVRTGLGWTQQAYLKASNAEADDRFGSSVDIDGDTLVVGAATEWSGSGGVDADQSDNSVEQAGAVYVFVRDGTTWTQQAYIKAPAPGVLDYFGDSVAISGDRLVVGAPYATGREQGAAFVYHRTGTTWSFVQMLTASPPTFAGWFGGSVDIHGTRIIVGAAGEERAYTFTPGILRPWVSSGTLVGSGTSAGDYFGHSVAINGNMAVVGAPSSGTGTGEAYVFSRKAPAWVERARLTASNAQAVDRFGARVAIDGDTLAVSALQEDSSATGIGGDGTDNSAEDAGAVYTFTRSGTAWNEQLYIKASNTDPFDSFGIALALSGTTIAVGAIFEASAATGINGDQSDNSAPDAGAVYVYGPKQFVFIRDLRELWSLLPDGSLIGKGIRNAFLARLDHIEKLAEADKPEQAAKQLALLRIHFDGCLTPNGAPDKNDWLTDCAAQLALRALIDDGIKMLTG